MELAYFDVELQVLVHGVDVVEDVLHDPWDDAHVVCVVQQALETRGRNTMVHGTTARNDRTIYWGSNYNCLNLYFIVGECV